MNIVVSNVTELQIQREILNMFSSIQQSTSSKLSLVQIETAEYYILIWDTITCSPYKVYIYIAEMWRRKKAKWYFLPLKMMCKFCSTILFLSFRQEMDLLDPLIWSYGGNLRLPLTHFKIKSEPSASKGLSNSVFICKNYRSEQKDDSYFHR